MADNETRKDILEQIKNPLGFFTLAILILEAIFGVVVAVSGMPPAYIMLSLVLMAILFLVVIGIVAYITIKWPENLLGEIDRELGTHREKIEANTEVIKRLAALEQAMADSEQEKQLIMTGLVNEFELEHLRRLASDRPQLRYERHESLKQELRRLRTLGFIESQPGKHIGFMSEKGNLRDYVKITERGKSYLELLESKSHSVLISSEE